MLRNIKMEEVLAASQELIKKWTPVQSSNCPQLISSNNTKYGELLVPREAAETVLRSTGFGQADKEGAVRHLNKHFVDRLAYPDILFVEIRLIRQCHLFLRLNRPYVYSKFIHQITTCKETYGVVEIPTERHYIIIIVPHVLCDPHVNPAELTLTEARSLLVAALLQNVLVGHSVKVYPKLHKDITQPVSLGVPDLFRSLVSVSHIKEPDHHLTQHEFICSFLPEASTHTSTVSGRAHAKLCNVVVNAASFTAESKLQGKGGYEKNIDSIQVTDESGQLTQVAHVAHTICAMCLNAHTIIHIAPQQKSHQTQQTMILVDMLRSSIKQQHISVAAAVNVYACSGKTVQYSLSDLFRLRQEQMASAFSVKYGDKLSGDHLQKLAGRMAEAVVKFELLSHDPTSYVKLEVPEQQSPNHEEVDVRFDGAFVLYNYARVATLLNNHKLACERGAYPPLPPVEAVDFALLKEEEEWQLMFLYMLQWPLLVKEAAQFTKRGVGVHINLGIKKVCQFLTKFSHAFSSYYGRTKVLMPPEAHLLPLIHARLYLMISIKQVMYNALKLLGIEPFEQL